MLLAAKIFATHHQASQYRVIGDIRWIPEEYFYPIPTCTVQHLEDIKRKLKLLLWPAYSSERGTHYPLPWPNPVDKGARTRLDVMNPCVNYLREQSRRWHVFSAAWSPPLRKDTTRYFGCMQQARVELARWSAVRAVHIYYSLSSSENCGHLPARQRLVHKVTHLCRCLTGKLPVASVLVLVHRQHPRHHWQATVDPTDDQRGIDSSDIDRDYDTATAEAHEAEYKWSAWTSTVPSLWSLTSTMPTYSCRTFQC